MRTFQILNRNKIFNELCLEVEKIGFHFAAISLVSTEHHTIEAVYGTGIFKDIAGRAKHFLDDEQTLRDIQADIVKTGLTEVISGEDDRFDSSIYQEFNHDQLIRVFAPLIICKDRHGKLVNDWLQHGQWTKQKLHIKHHKNDHQIFELILDPEFIHERIVIGTVEAGLHGRENLIDDSKVFSLNRLLSFNAIRIWKTKLLSLLEEVSQEAVESLNADAASIHYLYNKKRKNYVYQAYSSGKGYSHLKTCQPRDDGIGRKAIELGTYQLSPPIDSPHRFENHNPSAAKLGFKFIAAFPLKFALDGFFSDRSEEDGIPKHEGVLYVGFQRYHQFTDIEVNADKFVRRASEAIQQVLIYKHYQERNSQLTTLHSITKALADISDENELLRRITWNGMNILAADVVTLYEYDQADLQFKPNPILAGRLRNKNYSKTINNDAQIPAWLVHQKENIYLTSIESNSTFRSSFFAQEENIVSVAGIQLRDGDEIVGVMFINYRRLNDFSLQKEIIDILASSAAIAIKNHRWLNAIAHSERLVITSSNQDELINTILKQAVILTSAESGTLKLQLPDPNSNKLTFHTKAIYPGSNSTNKLPNSLIQKTVEGIEDKVAEEKRSTVNHIDACAVLCAPLLDGENILQGILTLQSSSIRSFKSKQLLIHTLASFAPIGLHNLELKAKLVHEKAVGLRSLIYRETDHQMNNTIGAIKTLARSILDALSSQDMSLAKEDASRIVSTADAFLKNAEKMKYMRNEEKAHHSLYEIIQEIVIDLPPNINFSLDLNNCPRVYAGRDQLKIVFKNLINNAIDAMESGGSLKIQGRVENESEDSSMICVKVKDTGVGIEAQHIENIFRDGFTTKSGMGKGSGLTITRYIVQHLLGGEINVRSVQSQGTELILKLPIGIIFTNHNSEENK
jgi:signal transduction histidine kinase